MKKIIKRNMNLQMNLAGIRADFEEALQRQWVGLTDEERDEITNKVMIDIWQVARAVEAKLKAKNERKEKNT